jgi:hypothetical protein
VRVGRREALYPHRLHKQNTTEKRQKMFTALDAAIFILAGVIVGYVIRLAQEMIEEREETE